MSQIFKAKRLSVTLLAVVGILVFLANAIWGIDKLPAYTSSLLTIVGVVILALEIGLKKIMKPKSLEPLEWATVIIGVVALLGALSSMVGHPIGLFVQYAKAVNYLTAAAVGYHLFVE